MMIICCIECKAFLREVLNWCSQNSALIIAVAGFVSSIVIAKITSGLDLQKTLCVRRFEAYEKAMRQLSLKLNLYANILASLPPMKEAVSDVGILKARIAVVLAWFVKLSENEQREGDLSGVVVYSDFPSRDVRPMMKEMSEFVALLNELLCSLDGHLSCEQLYHASQRVADGVTRFEPFVVEEAAHLNVIYEKLKEDIRRDKRIKRLLRYK